MMQSNVTQSVKLARSKARRLCYRGGVKESGVPWVVFGNRREGIVQHVDIHAQHRVHNVDIHAQSGTIRDFRNDSGSNGRCLCVGRGRPRRPVG